LIAKPYNIIKRIAVPNDIRTNGQQSNCLLERLSIKQNILLFFIFYISLICCNLITTTPTKLSV
jgi:hypothetical protein